VLLFRELRAGRLRQGWGYDSLQDLRVIWAEKERGGEWWNRLNNAQRDALPNMRLLGKEGDHVQQHDLLLLPNLPDMQSFCIAEVRGVYKFAPLRLTEAQDVNELGADYGHIIPVGLITPRGISRYHHAVHAELRSTMRTPMRMWNLDRYGKWIFELVARAEKGEDLSSPSSGLERLQAAIDKSREEAKEAMKSGLMTELRAKFQAAEWEQPIVEAMKKLYPSSEVQWTGGPNEHGADAVVSIPNYFGDQTPWLILVQVKNYDNEIGPEVLEQIAEAYEYYRDQGEVLCAVVATTADRKSQHFERQRKRLEKSLQETGRRRPVYLVAKDQLADLLAEAFLRF
jgi:Restriction endonuclease